MPASPCTPKLYAFGWEYWSRCRERLPGRYLVLPDLPTKPERRPFDSSAEATEFRDVIKNVHFPPSLAADASTARLKSFPSNSAYKQQARDMAILMLGACKTR